jgi:hypothetical protein
MAIDIQSFLAGSATVLLVAVFGIFFLISLLRGKATKQLKFVLTKLYSRTSLMLIALFDVVAAFDPTQLFLGAPLGLVAGITVFLSEWGLHDRFKINRLGASLVEGFIAGIIVLIPLPIAGVFVAWFGMVGDKKKK